MNQYLFLRRMRGPIFLLIFGVTALLDEYTGISYSMSWPLYIIAWGVIKLAENAILAQNPPPPPGQFQYPGYPGYGASTAAASATAADSTTQSTAIVPATGEDRR
ncbi:MAG TPA: hypothetical protein VJS11_11410 [Acidobacteriaceae bacterium]|nr:hypothetical protein [Acidobacteriaceae bacterium]